MMTSPSLTLRVTGARSNYDPWLGVGITEETMRSLAISDGDVVEIRSDKRAIVAAAIPVVPDDRGNQVIVFRSGKLLCNARVRLGEWVEVRRAHVQDAVQVVFAPYGGKLESIWGPGGLIKVDEEGLKFFKEASLGQVFSKGDLWDPWESVGSLKRETVGFIVKERKPSGYLRVTETTDVRIDENQIQLDSALEKLFSEIRMRNRDDVGGGRAQQWKATDLGRLASFAVRSVGDTGRESRAVLHVTYESTTHRSPSVATLSKTTHEVSITMQWKPKRVFGRVITGGRFDVEIGTPVAIELRVRIRPINGSLQELCRDYVSQLFLREKIRIIGQSSTYLNGFDMVLETAAGEGRAWCGHLLRRLLNTLSSAAGEGLSQAR